MSRAGGAARAAGGGEASRLQAEMLQLDLIDAAGDTPAEEQTAPEPLQKDPPAGTTDVYRPKRPTTLNLFPQVPRSQVRRDGGLRAIGWCGGGGRMLPPSAGGFYLGRMEGGGWNRRRWWGSVPLPAMLGGAAAPAIQRSLPFPRRSRPRAGRSVGRAGGSDLRARGSSGAGDLIAARPAAPAHRRASQHCARRGFFEGA